MELEKELKKLLEEWRSEVGKIDKSLLSLVDEFIKSNEGGKRIRGKLVMLGYEIAEKSSVVSRQSSDNASLKADSEASLKTDSSIMQVAAAYEIFHTAILAHDDIIDKSLERRGQASLYQALGGDHQGVSLALTLADAGFFLAVKIISEADFPEKQKNEALKYFSKIMLETAMGQILDIEKGDSLTVAKYKTAKYTVSGSLVLGALLGGAQESLVRAFGELGEALGIAFQIQDDILDSEVDWLGGFEQAKKEAKKYSNLALKIIPQITKESKMSKILLQLVEDLVERSR